MKLNLYDANFEANVSSFSVLQYFKLYIYTYYHRIHLLFLLYFVSECDTLEN